MFLGCASIVTEGSWVWAGWGRWGSILGAHRRSLRCFCVYKGSIDCGITNGSSDFIAMESTPPAIYIWAHDAGHGNLANNVGLRSVPS